MLATIHIFSNLLVVFYYISFADCVRLMDTPFEIIANYIIRDDCSKGGPNEFSQFDLESIAKALNKLSASQTALKNMDSASHVLNNAVSDKRYYFPFSSCRFQLLS